MLDRLFGFLLSILSLFKFWIVIDAFEAGALLRFGKRKRALEPGIHFMMPFRIDECFVDNTVPKSPMLREQSLTTFDDVSLVLTPVVTWRIVDIMRAQCDVEELDSSMAAEVAGVIGRQVAAADWDDVGSAEFMGALRAACNDECARYGIEIEQVAFADLSRCRSLRLLGMAPAIQV